MTSKTGRKSADQTSQVRVDIWLWAVRIFKNRSLAADACRNGRVQIAGQKVKPSRQVRTGDEILVEKGPLIRTVGVKDILRRRVAAKLVDDYLEDRTTEEALARAEAIRHSRQEKIASREAGTGRPTKKERRDLNEVMADAEDRKAFHRKVNSSVRTGISRLLMWSLIGIGAGMIDVGAEDPPKRGFSMVEGSLQFQVSENLSISAKKVAPETDPSTGALKGLSATGNVIIKVRPKGVDQWIVVSCEKATYDPSKDEIKLTGWPAVKSGIQVLRATSAETYVKVARATGKWEIDGPHKIELSFGKKKQ